MNERVKYFVANNFNEIQLLHTFDNNESKRVAHDWSWVTRELLCKKEIIINPGDVTSI